MLTAPPHLLLPGGAGGGDGDGGTELQYAHSGVELCSATIWQAAAHVPFPSTFPFTHVICSPHVPCPFLACVFQICSVQNVPQTDQADGEDGGGAGGAGDDGSGDGGGKEGGGVDGGLGRDNLAAASESHGAHSGVEACWAT